MVRFSLVVGVLSKIPTLVIEDGKVVTGGGVNVNNTNPGKTGG